MNIRISGWLSKTAIKHFRKLTHERHIVVPGPGAGGRQIAVCNRRLIDIGRGAMDCLRIPTTFENIHRATIFVQ